MNRVETSGLLSSEQQSNLSFKTSGIINRILVKEGDHVSNGQVLASLNMTEVNAQLNQAEEGFNKAKRDAQRTANLFKDSVSTREQLENTQTALAIAKKVWT
ncbi:biotin/lipoyl-binding protein [Pedobacter panaciterrae]